MKPGSSTTSAAPVRLAGSWTAISCTPDGGGGSGGGDVAHPARGRTEATGSSRERAVYVVMVLQMSGVDRVADVLHSQAPAEPREPAGRECSEARAGETPGGTGERRPTTPMRFQRRHPGHQVTDPAHVDTTLAHRAVQVCQDARDVGGIEGGRGR